MQKADLRVGFLFLAATSNGDLHHPCMSECRRSRQLQLYPVEALILASDHDVGLIPIQCRRQRSAREFRRIVLTAQVRSYYAL